DSSSAALVNFRHKAFVDDLLQLRLKPEALGQRLARELGEEEALKILDELRGVAAELFRQPDRPLEIIRKYPQLLELYSTCTAEVENDGHPFGQDLPDTDKKALIAFLATI